MSRRNKGKPIHGWIVLDKPLHLTSSQAVGAVKRALGAQKAGHAGTLDPLATGVLPIALGEATKTIAWSADGQKTYCFALRWGEARSTDDAEGDVTATNPLRPSEAEIRAALPRFIGTIAQMPPAFSALKIQGERAYALARRNQPVELAARNVTIHSLDLLGVDGPDRARFEAVVGPGTYIRALGRDLALALGTLAYVIELKRVSVGCFTLERAISLDKLQALGHSAAASEHLLPLETALDDIPALALTEDQAKAIRCGQAVTPLHPTDRARLSQIGDGARIRATNGGRLVALAEVAAGGIRPLRVINV
jgi:tRNA pseudouridine55 synthase